MDIDGVTHRYGELVAIQDVSLSIKGGELIALLGPSGCGKTTLLKIIAGFLTPTTGAIRVDGEPIHHVDTTRRGIGIVFQNYALFPHMSIRENIAYGLRARRVNAADIERRVKEMLQLIQLEGIERRYPRELSGGQQQRVALARALVVQPRILLLDEPFGALDKGLRLDMQIEIKRIQRQFGITTILVTHDQEEALSMADRVAVMDRGVVEQFATPKETYDEPATLFVSSFVGTSNLLEAEVTHVEDGGRLTLRLASSDHLEMTSVRAFSKGARVAIAIRPERIRIERVPSPESLGCTVRMAMPLGPSTVYELELRDGTRLKAVEMRMPGSEVLGPDMQVFMNLPCDVAFPMFSKPQ